LKAKPGDHGVEIGTRRVGSWKAGCTCALNLHAMDPAQLEFCSAYISATQPQNAENEDTPLDDATSADDSELQLPMQQRKMHFETVTL